MMHANSSQMAQAPAHWKWRQVPEFALIVNGQVIELHEEIGTRQAARLLRCHPATVVKMCDTGKLRQGFDWRKLPSSPNGPYLIREGSIMELLQQREAERKLHKGD
jgi:Helix-turn-helix domain